MNQQFHFNSSQRQVGTLMTVQWLSGANKNNHFIRQLAYTITQYYHTCLCNLGHLLPTQARFWPKSLFSCKFIEKNNNYYTLRMTNTVLLHSLQVYT